MQVNVDVEVIASPGKINLIPNTKVLLSLNHCRYWKMPKRISILLLAYQTSPPCSPFPGALLKSLQLKVPKKGNTIAI